MFDRRSILKLLGGGVVGTLLTPMPYKLLYDAAYWTQNWSWIPRLKYGENAYVPAVSKICPSGAGVLIRTVDGRPVRALGNPDNPLSQGVVSALAATETQLACAPSRVKKPLRRSPDGAYVAISWEDAMALLEEKASEAGSNIACLSGDNTSSVNDLYSAFLNKVHSSRFYFMPSDEQSAQSAWGRMGGKGRIAYDVENADFIFAVGANYLENWGPVIYNRMDFNAKRQTEGENALTLAYAGASQTNTAACADYTLIAKPDSELVILLGIANYLIKHGKASSFTDYAGFAKLASEYTSEKVAELTGISKAKFDESLQALEKANNPLIIVGSEANQGMGVAPIMAGIACNMLLGGDSAGQLKALPFPAAAFTDSMAYATVLQRNFVSYAQNVAKGEEKAPALFIMHEANPIYSLPKNAQVSELINKAGFTVSFACFMNESAMQSDLILPLSLGFESFDDVYTPYGCGFVNYAVGQPAAKLTYDTKSAADVMLALASSLGIEFPIGNAAELCAYKAEALGADMDSLIEGEAFVSDETVEVHRLSFSSDIIAKALAQNLSAQGKIQLCINAMRGIGTAQTGIPPFSTKIMTNDQLIGKYMVAQLNKKTADSLSLRDGARVKLSNEHGSITAVIALFEGIQDNCMLVPYGLGHTAFDDFSQNKGDNVINLTSVVAEAGTGFAMWSPMYVTAQGI